MLQRPGSHALQALAQLCTRAPAKFVVRLRRIGVPLRRVPTPLGHVEFRFAGQIPQLLAYPGELADRRLHSGANVEGFPVLRLRHVERRVQERFAGVIHIQEIP